MTARSNRARAALAVPVLSGAALGFLTACGGGVPYDEDGVDRAQQESYAYCAGEDGVVLPDSACDTAAGGGGGGGGAFIFVGGFGGQRYSPGQVIPPEYRSGSGTTRVSPGDAAARSRAGLPASGKVTSGTRVAGGIGKGAAGGGAKAGS